MTRVARLATALAWGGFALLSPRQSRAQTTGADALSDIVATWQSDTTGGVSALSQCTWTPARLSVICEQRITTPAGTESAENFFTFDQLSRRYYFYGLRRPGEAMHPVPLEIANHVWIYGGGEKDEKGVYWRTVNDFSGGREYTWRRESSTDGQHWTSVASGRSRRVDVLPNGR